MAIFIVYGVYHHDEDMNDHETLYVGIDGKEAFKVGVDGFESLSLEVWVDNQLIEKQEYKHHKYGWIKKFNLLEDMEKEIKNHLEQAKKKEAKFKKLKSSIHSEGIHI